MKKKSVINLVACSFMILNAGMIFHLVNDNKNKEKKKFLINSEQPSTNNDSFTNTERSYIKLPYRNGMQYDSTVRKQA